MGKMRLAARVGWYLSAVPFDRIGFRTDLGTAPIPTLSKPFLSLVSPVFIVIPALAMGIYSFKKRRDQIEKDEINKALEKKEGK